MRQPDLAQAVASAGRRRASAAALGELTAALGQALGPQRVSTVEAVRRAASTDFSHLSPLLPTVLGGHVADVVCLPATVEQLMTAVRLAHRYRVPVTPRGGGTGNYGQSVPLAGGLVLDLTRCDRVLEVSEGRLRAEAGATFVAVDAAAARTGQEVALMPTTAGSTLGGFLAGGAGGVGSIEHGWIWDGFVLALDVVTCPPGDAPLAVHGMQCRGYLHAYGVSGIIATATIRLVPRRPRVAAFASFPAPPTSSFAAPPSTPLPAQPDPGPAALLAVARIATPPRLVSLDEPDLVATYPHDDAMPPGRSSLRAILDNSTVDCFASAVTGHGGRVEAIRPRGAGYLTTLAFNHVTLRARKTRPDLCHLQVGGEPLVVHPDRVRAALPGAMLHLDAARVRLDPLNPTHGRHVTGLLLSPFIDAATLYEGVRRLEELGVFVVDPHTFLLGGPYLGEIAALAARNDPDGLLNPGKLG